MRTIIEFIETRWVALFILAISLAAIFISVGTWLGLVWLSQAGIYCAYTAGGLFAYLIGYWVKHWLS